MLTARPIGTHDCDDDRLPLRKLIALVGPALKLVWHASPREMLTVVVLQVLSGLALPAQVVAGKWALDAVITTSRGGLGIAPALPAIGGLFAAMAWDAR